jgi:diketogulonate reductase-like aldo/keto reductase
MNEREIGQAIGNTNQFSDIFSCKKYNFTDQMKTTMIEETDDSKG